ncbi:MAG TPA: serine acetyltransferase [Gammaproteobacteria bacterium]
MGLIDCFTLDLKSRDARHYTFAEIVERLFLKYGYRVIVYYRLAMYLKNVRVLRPMAKLVSVLLLVRIARVPGVEIRAVNEIGPGFMTFHPHDIVIGAGAKVGRNVTIYNGVTLGAKSFEELDDSKDVLSDYPTIEDDVTIFTGAKLIGPITIGRNSVVGANSVVLESFPPDSVIAGVPARIVGRRE